MVVSSCRNRLQKLWKRVDNGKPFRVHWNYKGNGRRGDWSREVTVMLLRTLSPNPGSSVWTTNLRARAGHQQSGAPRYRVVRLTLPRSSCTGQYRFFNDCMQDSPDRGSLERARWPKMSWAWRGKTRSKTAPSQEDSRISRKTTRILPKRDGFAPPVARNQVPTCMFWSRPIPCPEFGPTPAN